MQQGESGQIVTVKRRIAGTIPTEPSRITSTGSSGPGGARSPFDAARFLGFRKYWVYSGGIAKDLQIEHRLTGMGWTHTDGREVPYVRCTQSTLHLGD